MHEADFALHAHPSQFELGVWLASRTPAHAPVLVVDAPGARSAVALPRLRTPASPASRRGPRRRGAAPALHAAFLVDVEGRTPFELVEPAPLALPDERSARQHVRDGRFVGAELGVWPWAVVEGQALPRSWWTEERFARALADWAGDLRPPEVEPAVRRIGRTVEAARPIA